MVVFSGLSIGGTGFGVFGIWVRKGERCGSLSFGGEGWGEEVRGYEPSIEDQVAWLAVFLSNRLWLSPMG